MNLSLPFENKDQNFFSSIFQDYPDLYENCGKMLPDIISQLNTKTFMELIEHEDSKEAIIKIINNEIIGKDFRKALFLALPREKTEFKQFTDKASYLIQEYTLFTFFVIYIDEFWLINTEKSKEVINLFVENKYELGKEFEEAYYEFDIKKGKDNDVEYFIAKTYQSYKQKLLDALITTAEEIKAKKKKKETQNR